MQNKPTEHPAENKVILTHEAVDSGGYIAKQFTLSVWDMSKTDVGFMFDIDGVELAVQAVATARELNTYIRIDPDALDLLLDLILDREPSDR